MKLKVSWKSTPEIDELEDELGEIDEYLGFDDWWHVQSEINMLKIRRNSLRKQLAKLKEAVSTAQL